MKKTDTFKVGDFVLIEDGIPITDDKELLTNNWGGTVVEVIESHEQVKVSYDATTLRKLSKAFFEDAALMLDNEPWCGYFDYEDIRLSQSRDRLEDYQVVFNSVFKEYQILLEEPEFNEEDFLSPHQPIIDSVINGFLQSNFCEGISEKEERKRSVVIRDIMMYMLDDLQLINSNDWEPSMIKEYCLNIAPNRIPSSDAFFRAFGENLILFFRYIESNKILDSAENLIETINEIKSTIPQKASDKSNWTPEKTAFMEQGIDILEVSIDDIFETFGISQDWDESDEFDDMFGDDLPIIKPFETRINPFKKYGRNDRITVKYLDGRILENVKFKKVESDLKEGECVIVD